MLINFIHFFQAVLTGKFDVRIIQSLDFLSVSGKIWVPQSVAPFCFDASFRDGPPRRVDTTNVHVGVLRGQRHTANTDVRRL